MRSMALYVIEWMRFHHRDALIVIIVSISLFLWCTCLLFPLYRTFCSRIPNAHFLAPFTSFWIIWVRHKGREIQVVEDAHRRLGPVVRLGPREVSINGDVREIYAGRLDKSHWYTFFGNYGYS